MSVIYTLLVAHFVGDFICQTDWMALNKSKRWDALAIHVFVYTAVLFAFVNVAQVARGGFQAPMPMETLTGIALFCTANFAAHFIQDAITSRITSRLWFVDGVTEVKQWRGRFPDDPMSEFELIGTRYEVAYNNKRHWFFVAIGFDQLLHYVTLFVTAGWWLQ